jgi:L-seryl-tRNA(Ser) seleniumtransferase
MGPQPPSVDALATTLDDGVLPKPLVIEVARQAISEWRTGGDRQTSPEQAAGDRLARLRRLRPGRLINATGVLLHTNLGRAPLSGPAAEAQTESSVGYTALEYDLDSGQRGSRAAYATRLAAALCGAEDALVVNNNAGALFLTLCALAGGAEAVISRGELIEIGGSFRLPELMAASTARMIEVGTTNRTRMRDYRKACGPDTALILKVHPSNYRIEGFTAQVDYPALAQLAKDIEVPFAADLGSGLLDARTPWLGGPPPAWLANEPAARQTIAAGADLVMFSGDKLLGGPQAGVIAGRSHLIHRLAEHPAARALRIDAARLAALTITLETYARGAGSEIPFWRMATIPYETLEERCRRVIATSVVDAAVEPGVSLPGAGSAPGRGIPSPLIIISRAGEQAWRSLLAASPPIVARREDQGLVLDLRAVEPADDGAVAEAIAAACR